MTHRHQVAPTTRTLEMRQVGEINGRLADPDRPRVTAALMCITGEPILVARTMFPGLISSDTPTREVLPARAVLGHVEAKGSPDFPYLLGHFFVGPAALDAHTGPGLVVSLHTLALCQLSDVLGLHHSWGTVGTPRADVDRIAQPRH